MNRKDHPFYCFEKHCRKTAWDTPEYLTPIDWLWLAEFIPVLHSGNPDLIWRALYKSSLLYEGKSQGEAFFDRFIGWPEGHVYCSSAHYWEKSGCAMVLRHLPQLEQALRLLRPLESEAK